MRVMGVIPARYGSTRLAGKPLADINGKPMIQHVYELACQAKTLDIVVVATDDQRVFDVVRNFGGTAVMTKIEHFSGMDRVAEVAAHSDADIVVNVQGDEPLLDPIMIDECVNALKGRLDAELSTVIKAVGEESFGDPSVVKVVRDNTGARSISRAHCYRIHETKPRTSVCSNISDYTRIAKTAWRGSRCFLRHRSRRLKGWSNYARSRTASPSRWW